MTESEDQHTLSDLFSHFEESGNCELTETAFNQAMVDACEGGYSIEQRLESHAIDFDDWFVRHNALWEERMARLRRAIFIEIAIEARIGPTMIYRPTVGHLNGKP